MMSRPFENSVSNQFPFVRFRKSRFLIKIVDYYFDRGNGSNMKLS